MENISDNDILPEFTQCWTVEWDISSATGRLSIPGLLNLLQLTAGHHAAHCRIGYYDMAKADQAWVLNRLKVRFFSLPKWTEKVEVTTWVEDFTGVFSVRSMHIHHKGELIAEVSTLWACINYKKRVAETLAIVYPKELMNTDKKVSIGNPARVRIPKSVRLMKTHRVVFSDIDAMGHVNNVKYTQWIIDALDHATAMSLTSGEIEMNFLSETHLNDVVNIEQGLFDEKNVFVITKVGESKPAFVSRYTAL